MGGKGNLLGRCAAHTRYPILDTQSRIKVSAHIQRCCTIAAWYRAVARYTSFVFHINQEDEGVQTVQVGIENGPELSFSKSHCCAQSM